MLCWFVFLLCCVALSSISLLHTKVVFYLYMDAIILHLLHVITCRFVDVSLKMTLADVHCH